MNYEAFNLNNFNNILATNLIECDWINFDSSSTKSTVLQCWKRNYYLSWLENNVSFDMGCEQLNYAILINLMFDYIWPVDKILFFLTEPVIYGDGEMEYSFFYISLRKNFQFHYQETEVL
jgi:hypothetical protein